VHALFARIVDCDAISLRNIAAEIEQRPVEIEGEQAYGHKENDKVAQKEMATKRLQKHKIACSESFVNFVLLCG
jgi:hypothetical protein